MVCVRDVYDSDSLGIGGACTASVEPPFLVKAIDYVTGKPINPIGQIRSRKPRNKSSISNG